LVFRKPKSVKDIYFLSCSWHCSIWWFFLLYVCCWICVCIGCVCTSYIVSKRKHVYNTNNKFLEIVSRNSTRQLNLLKNGITIMFILSKFVTFVWPKEISFYNSGILVSFLQ
jgi:hypothetical protein